MEVLCKNKVLLRFRQHLPSLSCFPTLIFEDFPSCGEQEVWKAGGWVPIPLSSQVFFIIITIFFSCHSFSRKTYLLVLWEGEVFYLLLLWDLSWWCVHYPHYTAEKAKFGSMSSTNPLQQRHHIYKLYIYSVLCTEKRLISICCDREGVASRLFHRSSQEQQVHCHTPGVQNSLGPPSGHAVFLVMAFKMQERGGTGGGRGGFRF